MKLFPGIILFFSISLATAAQINLAWDSAGPAASTFNIYAHTNAINATNLVDALVRVHVGTNRTATLNDLAEGTWHFAATAVLGGVESAPSSNLVATVPPAPQNLRTVILQYSADLTNWTNVNFFKLKVP